MKYAGKMGTGAALLCALLLTGGVANAATVRPVFNLDEVVVTATKIPENIARVPAEVSVVTAKDIQEHNYTNTSQALGQLPGIYLNPGADGGSAGGDTITMRGFDSKDILVMVDGQPMNSGWNGEVNWSLIPVENIAKIEVVRGAASSLYGGRAVGGVIAITTKEHKDGLHGDVVLSYGSNATTKQVYDASFKKDKWDFGVGYEKRKSHGWRGYYVDASASDEYDDEYPMYEANLPRTAYNDYIIGGRGKRANTTESYHFKTTYHFNDDQSLTYSYTHSNWTSVYNHPFSYIRDADGHQVFQGYAHVGEDRYVFFEPGDFLGYRNKRELSMHNISYDDTKNMFHARFGITDIRKDGYSSSWLEDGNFTADELDDYNGAGGQSFYPSKTRDFDMNKTWELGKHTLLAGAGYRSERFDQTRYELSHWKSTKNREAYEKHGGKGETWAGYIQDKWQATDRLAIYGGVRYDRYKKSDGYDNFLDTGITRHHESKTFTEWSPKFSIEYTLPSETTFYASYGHSFTPPILSRVYRSENARPRLIDGQWTVTQRGSLANPGLKPETTDTYEIGVKKKWENTSLTVSAYKANTDDAIRYFSTRQPTMYNGMMYQRGFSQYRNSGEAKKKGFELNLDHNFTKAWSGYLNWAWETEKVDGSHNYYIPRHIFHFGVEYDMNKWDILMDGEFIAARNEPDQKSGSYSSEDPFFLLNLSANYDITKNATVQFSIYNLLDRKFYADEAASERTYSVTMRYNF